MKPEEKAKLLAAEYKSRILQHGYTVSDIGKGNFNYEFTVSGKSGRLKVLTYFSAKGNKVILQGKKDSGLFQEVNRIIFGESFFSTAPEYEEPVCYIGTDESGKGDFFGPLVAAGVYADEEIKKELIKAGVKDSKLLSDAAVREIDQKIKSIPLIKYNIVVINPQKYNELYYKFHNLNRLLGWAHARVLENILNVQDCPAAISDKFGDEKFIIASLQSKGKQLNLIQQHRAERYTAVAAASILARRRMLNWFELSSAKYGMEIPKGASAQVEAAARKLKDKFGEAELDSLIKKHFKTTQKL